MLATEIIIMIMIIIKTDFKVVPMTPVERSMIGGGEGGPVISQT